MTTGKTQVLNESGLHARPASMFVKMAKGFESEIMVRNLDKDGPFVNALSLIHI